MCLFLRSTWKLKTFNPSQMNDQRWRIVSIGVEKKFFAMKVCFQSHAWESDFINHSLGLFTHIWLSLSFSFPLTHTHAPKHTSSLHLLFCPSDHAFVQAAFLFPPVRSVYPVTFLACLSAHTDKIFLSVSFNPPFSLSRAHTHSQRHARTHSHICTNRTHSRKTENSNWFVDRDSNRVLISGLNHYFA